MTAADLRHALRTPLNHIIGYAEMLQEDSGAIPVFSLSSLLTCAKDLVTFIQAALAAGDHPVDEWELQKFRHSLLAPVQRLAYFADSLLTGSLSSGGRQDAERIRFAVERLMVFANDGPDSTPGLATSLPGGPGAPPERGDENLLIIDDNAENRDILRRHLERQGYGVETAADGGSGLELLGSGKYALVLLDVLMPVMDGFEVLRQMKMAPGLRDTPVVMISALDETNSVVRCVQMGAEDYLMKPFDPVLLSARIGASLEKKRLRDAERRRTEELQRALDELRRTQDQLLVQEKLASLGALTAGIAHEIKNPLNFVTNFASASVELISEISVRPEAVPLLEALGRLEGFVTKIDQHGKRADRIVRGMLLHSRGKPGDPESVEINDLLRDCLNLTYHGLRAHDREFNVGTQTALAPNAGSIHAVPQELSRVFLNIINNACYAAYQRKRKEGSDFHPMVTVRTKGWEDHVEITIEDNGGGIPEAVRPRLFDPFFTTKPAGEGTGLGLSLSHDIVVQRHRGTIGVESEPGEFSRFIVRLPRSAK